MARVTLEGLEAELLTRLKIYHEQITGVNRVFETPPANMLLDEDLPAVYFLLGEMADSVPQDQPHKFTISRNYIVRLLIIPFGRPGIETDDSGAYANTVAVPFYGRFRSRYVHYDRLQVPEESPPLDHLSGLAHGFSWRESGLRLIRGVGGQSFSGIDWTLTITAQFSFNEPRYWVSE